MMLQVVGKEEQLKHREDDYQFDDDNRPQSLTQRHLPEAVGIEAVYTVYEQVVSHVFH